MWEMAKQSMILFFRGQLFQDYGAVFRMLGLGILFTAVLFLVLVLAGLPPWLAAASAGFAGGFAQPWLFRDLKYR